MSNLVRRLFTKRPPGYEQATGLNPEGFPAFTRPLEERYLQVLLTNTLGHTFYASMGDNYTLAQEVHREMMSHDAHFAAQAIVYAREEGTMRLQPLIGLVHLSLVDRALFRAIFPRVVQTPGDLLDFVQIVRSKQIRPGLGRTLKEEINRWLNGLSEYHVMKYGSNAGAKLTLRDVLRMTHPQPIDEIHNSHFLYLTDREKWRETYGERIGDLVPHIAALERLKRTADPAEVRALVERGRLPYEIVTGAVKPDQQTWNYLMRQMPYFALLRHLNTLQRAGVLADPEVAAYVGHRLAKADAIHQAKILPFRLHAAWTAFEPARESEHRIKRALETALEEAFHNLPDLAGRVAIAPDVSGSMNGPIHRPSKVRYIDIAAIFAGALLKRSPRAVVLPFETGVVQVDLHRQQPLMEIADRLSRIGGGGTAVSAPVSKLLADRTVVDVFIGITDNIEWARDSYGGVGFLPTWRRYRSEIAPQAQAFLITIAPYPHAVAPAEEPGVHYIHGWADNVPAYIGQTLAGFRTQLDAVREVIL